MRRVHAGGDGAVTRKRTSRRYDRCDLADTIRAAKVAAAADGRTYYVFATYFGFTVHTRPPSAQRHAGVDPDGTVTEHRFDPDSGGFVTEVMA